jgi:hypothetical protein
MPRDLDPVVVAPATTVATAVMATLVVVVAEHLVSLSLTPVVMAVLALS